MIGTNFSRGEPVKMKLLRVRKKDAADITEQEAEKKFYAGYDPIKQAARKGVKQMYVTLYAVHDTIQHKKKVFEDMSVKLTKFGPNLLTDEDYKTYPALAKLRDEIGRLENLEKHFDFMIKGLGKEFLAQFGG